MVRLALLREILSSARLKVSDEQLVLFLFINDVNLLLTDTEELYQNVELAERFNQERRRFPSYLLFLEGKERPIKFDRNKRLYGDLLRFVRENTGNKEV